MSAKVLLTILENEVAPRFDLATEVVVAVLDSDGTLTQKRTVVLPQAGAENLCHLILSEGIETVICGGIEDEYYQYLTWKKVTVIDSVMAPWDRALEVWRQGGLEPEAMLFDRPPDKAGRADHV